MKLVGLTGSIGMGKTTTAGLFRDAGVRVYDADAAVHGLYAAGGAAVEPLREAFPEAVRGPSVDRAVLSRLVQDDRAALQRLEAIVHPLVTAAQRRFLEEAASAGVDLVVLDVPLLFETGGHTRVDAVVVVTAPGHVQRARVLGRAGMTEAHLDRLLARQMPDADKRARADFLVETSRGIDAARREVGRILAGLVHYAPRAWVRRRRGRDRERA